VRISTTQDFMAANLDITKLNMHEMSTNHPKLLLPTLDILIKYSIQISGEKSEMLLYCDYAPVSSCCHGQIWEALLGGRWGKESRRKIH